MNDKILRNIQSLSLKLKQNSPQIKCTVAAVGYITAVGYAIHDTVKAIDIIDEHKANIDDIKEDLEANVEDVKESDLAKEYIATGVDLVKCYWKTLSLTTGSTVLLILGTKEWDSKTAALAATVAGLESDIKKYRKNIIDKYGEEADEEARGIHKETIEYETKDENGKKKKVKEEVKVADEDILGLDEYSFYFDQGCREWSKSPEYNLTYLMGLEEQFNYDLQRRGHVFLNEVYDAVGKERTPQGQVKGWTREGTERISLGVFKFNRRTGDLNNGDVIRRIEPVIICSPNVEEEPIIQKI